jgi:hypothetical protein
LHLLPREEGIAQASIEDDCGRSLAGAVDVHLVAADVEKLSGHGMEATLAGLGDVFIDETDDEDSNDQSDEHANSGMKQRLGNGGGILRLGHARLPGKSTRAAAAAPRLADFT